MANDAMVLPALVEDSSIHELSSIADRARDYAAESTAPATRTAYRLGWDTFTAWCEGHGLPSLPATPESVALYLTARADLGRAVATITRELASISEAHKVAGLSSPRSDARVRAVMKGIRRTLGVAQRQAAPVLPTELRAMCGALPAGLLGIRDRALLCLGFAGAFRRSELVALDVGDLQIVTEGLLVRLRRSKTDQEGKGRTIAVPYGSHPGTCPVRAVRAWLDASCCFSTSSEEAKQQDPSVRGPVFRGLTRHGRLRPTRLTAQMVARVVKRSAARVGLDVADFSGHSLRAGFATAAARAGKSRASIKRQGGWRSDAIVDRYIRQGEIWDDNAATGVM